MNLGYEMRLDLVSNLIDNNCSIGGLELIISSRVLTVVNVGDIFFTIVCELRQLSPVKTHRKEPVTWVQREKSR